MLYYFKSADDPPNYKGLIRMRDCKVWHIDRTSQVVLMRLMRGGLVLHWLVL